MWLRVTLNFFLAYTFHVLGFLGLQYHTWNEYKGLMYSGQALYQLSHILVFFQRALCWNQYLAEKFLSEPPSPTSTTKPRNCSCSLEGFLFPFSRMGQRKNHLKHLIASWFGLCLLPGLVWTHLLFQHWIV